MRNPSNVVPRRWWRGKSVITRCWLSQHLPDQCVFFANIKISFLPLWWSISWTWFGCNSYNGLNWTRDSGRGVLSPPLSLSLQTFVGQLLDSPTNETRDGKQDRYDVLATKLLCHHNSIHWYVLLKTMPPSAWGLPDALHCLATTSSHQTITDNWRWRARNGTGIGSTTNNFPTCHPTN